jgi:hypothetical protein
MLRVAIGAVRAVNHETVTMTDGKVSERDRQRDYHDDDCDRDYGRRGGGVTVP